MTPGRIDWSVELREEIRTGITIVVCIYTSIYTYIPRYIYIFILNPPSKFVFLLASSFFQVSFSMNGPVWFSIKYFSTTTRKTSWRILTTLGQLSCMEYWHAQLSSTRPYPPPGGRGCWSSHRLLLPAAGDHSLDTPPSRPSSRRSIPDTGREPTPNNASWWWWWWSWCY